MKAHCWVLLCTVAGLSLGLAGACKKQQAPQGDRATQQVPKTVKWPAPPADGAPVVTRFESMAYKKDRWGAELRLFNFSARAVRAVQLTFHFLDRSGKALSKLAWPRTGQPLLKPKAHTLIQIKARMPLQTDTVTVSLNNVLFADGKSWKKPSKAPDKRPVVK